MVYITIGLSVALTRVQLNSSRFGLPTYVIGTRDHIIQEHKQ